MILDETLGLLQKRQTRILHVALSLGGRLLGLVGDIPRAIGLRRSQARSTFVRLLNEVLMLPHSRFSLLLQRLFLMLEHLQLFLEVLAGLIASMKFETSLTGLVGNRLGWRLYDLLTLQEVAHVLLGDLGLLTLCTFLLLHFLRWTNLFGSTSFEGLLLPQSFEFIIILKFLWSIILEGNLVEVLDVQVTPLLSTCQMHQ